MVQKKFSIIALASMAVIGVLVFGTLSTSDPTNNSEITPNQQSFIMVSNSYTTIDKNVMKEISETIVEGKITDKYQILQYRDVDGNYVKENSKKIAQTEPYTIYELLTTEVMKNGKTDAIIKFKTFGGNLKGTQVFTDMPSFEISDNVVVLLEPALDGEHYEITSGEFGIYKVTQGKAINANSEISVEQLKQSLR